MHIDVFFRGNSQIRYSKQNWARRTALFPEEIWMWIMWKILIFLFLPDFIIIYLYIMHVKVLSQKSHLKFHESFVCKDLQIDTYIRFTNVSNPLIAHIAITNVSEKRTYMFIIFMDTRNIDVFFRGYSQIPF